jgi:HAD superfamily hydrolase (TIGR01549 family)
MKHFSDILVCIWDIDGTLYPLTPAMSQEILEAAYQIIQEHMGWDRAKTLVEFKKVHHVITPSSTEAAAMICHMDTAIVAQKTDAYFNRLRYVKRDPKLITLFEQLSGYQHYLLGNGYRKYISQALDLLGIGSGIFKEIVTSEIVGVNKPEENGFRYILDKTGLPPWQHLMIGDREKVDLAPARALGMKTCLVWSTTKSNVADCTVDSVYDVALLFRLKEGKPFFA